MCDQVWEECYRDITSWEEEKLNILERASIEAKNGWAWWMIEKRLGSARDHKICFFVMFSSIQNILIWHSVQESLDGEVRKRISDPHQWKQPEPLVQSLNSSFTASQLCQKNLARLSAFPWEWQDSMPFKDSGRGPTFDAYCSAKTLHLGISWPFLPV